MLKTTRIRFSKKKIITAILLLFVLTGLLLAGCTDGLEKKEQKTEEPEDVRSTHLSIILGAHSNSTILNLEALRDDLTEFCSKEGNTITLILADGHPSVISQTQTKELPSFRTRSKIENIIEDRAEKIMSAAYSARAKYEEVDLLDAISLASRDLQKYSDEDSDRKLIILDTGLQTVSPLNFSTADISILSADSIASTLQESSAIPDLSGVEVIWHMTDPAAPQEELPASAQTNLENIWKAILSTGNASDVEIMKELPIDGSYENLPTVSTVPVAEDIFDLADFANGTTDNTDALRLSGESFLFVPDEATLIDPDAARASLAELADYMKENPSCEALLVGCTAKYGDLGTSLTLSYERAQTLENLFSELNVDPDRLRIVGTGWLSSALYQNDQAEDGSLLTKEAAENRCCVWVNTTCSMASQIRQDDNAGSYIWEPEA